jgi:DNA polymerase-3 subunit epsilon
MYTHTDEMEATTADKVVFIATETTGRNKQHDEVLSVAAVDLEGTVKMEQMFRPRHCKRWKRAMAINHITPEMTIGKPRLAEKKADLEQILNDADVVVGWNLPFDLRMLYAGGVDMPMANEKYIDLMKDFARAYNSTLPGKGKTKYKLEEAASIVGVEYDAHTALGDTSVLIPIGEWTRSVLAASDAPKAA